MMTETTVFKKTYNAPPQDRREILRYMGEKSGESSENVEKILDKCLADAENVLSYTAVWSKVSVETDGNTVIFPFSRVKTENLAKHLSGCTSAVIFAATVGLGIDRLIARYSVVSPVSALAFQSIGAERIEALCDLIEKDGEVVGEKSKTKARFSPGYGDLPLEFQKDIFAFLGCGKNAGITLNESLIMSPTKSVTAIIGIE